MRRSIVRLLFFETLIVQHLSFPPTAALSIDRSKLREKSNPFMEAAANSKTDGTKESQGVIVLLDPVTEWKSVLEAALKLKYQVIAVQLSPIPNSMRAFFPTPSTLEQAGACRSLDLQHRDVYSCVQALKLALRQLAEDSPPPLRAVIPLSETGVDFSDAIAAMMGLPNHNPLDLVLCKRDKGFMKETVRQSGLAVAKFARIGTDQDMLAQMKALSLDYPVVVKTPQGFSTKDVYICFSLDQATKALNQILTTIGPDERTAPCALLEEYIGGTEFAVNLLATAKKDEEGSLDLLVTDVWIYDKTDAAQYNSATMCDPNDPSLRVVCDYAKGVAKAVGVHYGAAHVEVKATAHGHGHVYADPIMMEIGARLSGGRKAVMTQAAYQNDHRPWDPFKALIQSHLGQLEIDGYMPSPPLHVQHLFLPVTRAGRVRARHCILDDATSSLETLHSFFWLVKPGDNVLKTTDITSCAGFVWLVGDKFQVKRDAELILSTFRIDYINEQF
jgi:D-alanine-D-alanine ligase-like ATP-grasp enzyme